MSVQDLKISVRVMARWAIIILLIRAGIGVIMDNIAGRPAVAPVAWPQAVVSVVFGVAVFFGLLWMAGLFSGLFGDGE